MLKTLVRILPSPKLSQSDGKITSKAESRKTVVGKCVPNGTHWNMDIFNTLLLKEVFGEERVSFRVLMF